MRRALTETQILILSKAMKNSDCITALLSDISRFMGIPLSTLKSSAKTLRELGLIRTGNGASEVTELGRSVLSMLEKR